MNVRDKVIVITGASSGFGELIARMCAQAGARLVLVARSTDKLEQLARTLGGPERVLAIPTDITDQAAVAQLAARVIAHFGRVDVLVNNAGHGIFDPVEQLPHADVAGMLDVNVLGALCCTQAFLPYMRKQRAGQIVVMASIAGLLPFRNMGGYAASKFALLGLFQTLQLELAGTGVRCAIICPGPSRTSFMQNIEVEKFPRITRILPWLKPEQVAAEVMRVINRRVNGRVIIPRMTIPLVLFGQAWPGLARLIMRLVG